MLLKCGADRHLYGHLLLNPGFLCIEGRPLGCGLGGSDCQTTPGTVLRWQVIYSFSDFDDTNFQHAEVSWYPDPPALDFWRRHGVLRTEQPCRSFQRGLNHSGFAFHSRGRRRKPSISKFLHIANLWPYKNALLKPWNFLLNDFDFPIKKFAGGECFSNTLYHKRKYVCSFNYDCRKIWKHYIR